VCMDIFEFAHGRPCMLLPFSIHMAGHVHNTILLFLGILCSLKQLGTQINHPKETVWLITATDRNGPQRGRNELQRTICEEIKPNFSPLLPCSDPCGQLSSIVVEMLTDHNKATFDLSPSWVRLIQYPKSC